jgi:hypothetical protein
MTIDDGDSFGVISRYLGRYSSRQDIAKGVRHSHCACFAILDLTGDVLTTCMQCLSGRGDKDVEQISQLLPGKWADILDWHVA